MDDEFVIGYMDGRDLDTPDPSDNRSFRYRHSFAIGRAKVLRKPVRSAQASRRLAYLAECKDGVA